jgi:hypothetical protein
MGGSKFGKCVCDCRLNLMSFLPSGTNLAASVISVLFNNTETSCRYRKSKYLDKEMEDHLFPTLPING